jgi:hypothetical protein
MPDAVLLLGAACSGTAGMAWLALAKLPHWRQVTGQATQTAGERRALRMAGGVALAVSLALCLAADHVSMSFLVWIMIMAAGSLCMAFMLAWRPRFLGWLAFRSDR